MVESYTTTSDYQQHAALSCWRGAEHAGDWSVDNFLARGEIPLGGKVTRFSNITAPIYVFAGASDVLVAASTTRQSLDMVKSKDTAYEVAPGGRVGRHPGRQGQDAVGEISRTGCASARSQSDPGAKAIASKPARAERAVVAGHDDSAVVLV
ncbi:MAG: hypothetical protein IPG34_12925 [Rhodocyclaceae bacterium]|nr:hypothetical protein [Rhodocyclaceae bacterium]